MARFEIINGLCEIPFGTTEIKDYEFSGCKNLVKVSIPNSVKSIGNMAFGGTNLESVFLRKFQTIDTFTIFCER